MNCRPIYAERHCDQLRQQRLIPKSLGADAREIFRIASLDGGNFLFAEAPQPPAKDSNWNAEPRHEYSDCKQRSASHADNTKHLQLLWTLQQLVHLCVKDVSILRSGRFQRPNDTLLIYLC